MQMLPHMLFRNKMGRCCLFLLFILSGCGYQFTAYSQPYRSKTISVPYAIGDQDGSFTNSLIYALTTGGYTYVKCGGELSVFVDLVDFRTENIGYRYDREKDGSLTRTLIPEETRLIGIARVSLIDCESGCLVVPAFEVNASVEFDHEYYTTRDGVNTFSLGQLTDYDAARTTAYHPLNKKLAQRIVEYISQIRCD